ncbi:DUF4097 family beta strand repeat-containing protein [Candidatus Soleaferrea massiliensis]|uniref:DUF4097 family beta strand repeat-containing protein n=1 Tax=Candidatus Soleaferrea massiliensis TaxID=1470354 RepID=UPI00058F2F17|nr:DUF4097 family beta strand repeat-containing protein [Candidatus Soleaferrea massiliensis]
MNTAQRVIKYVAMTFALLLAAGIIAAIFNVGIGVMNMFGMTSSSSGTIDFNETYQNVQNLEISCSYGELEIIPSNEFRVEAADVSSDFKSEVKNGTLVVKDRRGFGFFSGFGAHSKIIVYLPKDQSFESAKVECGAGEVHVDQLIADKLKLEIGAGAFYAKQIEADEADIKGGVGELRITDAKINDLDLDSGVGQSTIEGIVTGDSKVNTGIGQVSLTLDGRANDYYFDLKNGIGEISVDNQSYHGDSKVGDKSAANRFKINGGIGQVTVRFGN